MVRIWATTLAWSAHSRRETSLREPVCNHLAKAPSSSRRSIRHSHSRLDPTWLRLPRNLEKPPHHNDDGPTQSTRFPTWILKSHLCDQPWALRHRSATAYRLTPSRPPCLHHIGHQQTQPSHPPTSTHPSTLPNTA
jgi:hypothetical protein